mmetsp:Transcript_84184/g.261864  ORF Transcript_84184/g.261864 Transcript_84184/m.261864 type:complete len:656 (-) Transcript_84184:62-2029(-)
MAAVAEGSFQAVEEVPCPAGSEADLAEAQPEEDELRWSALTQVMQLPAEEPGTMRLMGNFQGTATTSTHQLDLGVGLDVEMPSAVAAEVMRLLEARCHSASTVAQRLTDGRTRPDPTRPDPTRPNRPQLVEQPDAQTLLSKLASFFDKDAQQDPHRAQADLRLKVMDVATYKQLRHRLRLDLEASQQELQRQKAALHKDLEQVRAEHAQAREELAAALAGKAAADTLASQVEASAQTLQKEHNELLARAGALSALTQSREDEVRELSQQLLCAQEKLSSVSAQGAELANELVVVRGQAMAEESAAAEARGLHLEALQSTADSRAEIAELKLRHKDHEVQAVESVRDMELRLQAATARCEAAEREVCTTNDKVQLALEERDRARKELREERQAGLGSSAKVQDELHTSRQGELKTAAQNRHLEAEVAKLRAKAASLQEELLAARSAVVVSEPIAAAAGAPVLLQNANGTCLMRSITAFPPTSVSMPTSPTSPTSSLLPTEGRRTKARASMPAMPTWTSAGVAMPKAKGTIKHIGTTTRVLATPGSPVPSSAGTSVVTSPPRTGASVMASPGSAGASVVTSPVPTGGVTISTRPAVAQVAVAAAAAANSPQVTQTVVTVPQPMQVVARSTPLHFSTPAGMVRGSVSVQVMAARRIQP